MSFEEFEHQARLYVLEAMEEDERASFEAARREFGQRAESVIEECRRLNAAFALALRPQPPKQEAKARLMADSEISRREARDQGLRQ
jgi:hypothetical protein